MCGVYFSNKNNNIKLGSKFINRGPDYLNEKKHNNFFMGHSLLSLTGEFTPQPVTDKNVDIIFNGQIYNYDKELYKSDSYFILNEYKKDKNYFWKNFDGEYAIVIFDLEKNCVIFLTDIFGTKPLFYSLENNIISISSLRTTLELNGHKDIIKCAPNTIYEFNFDSLKLTIQHDYFQFNLDQFKTSFEDWNSLFLKSIEKRFANMKHDIILPLSSGHDSGAIACALDLLDIKYYSFSFFKNENQKVLSKRLLKRYVKSPLKTKFKYRPLKQSKKETLTNYLYTDCDPYYYGAHLDVLNIDGRQDSGAVGLTYILEKSKKGNKNIKVVASGQGGDEIYSNNQSYNFGKSNPKFFKDDLREVFPWQNFYQGAQVSYLSKEESIGGSFGLETRYPFLDKELVQEYLNFIPLLKNKYYKSPITNFLQINNYPFREGSGKTGFSP